MTPTVGRIVHVNMPENSEYPAAVLAALITKVNEDSTVNLCVFGHTGFGWRLNVAQGSESGQWDWPPRV